MEILANPVVAAIVMIGALIFIHEAGHYLVGKFCGIAVEIFSIGFGPPIFQVTRGLTQYRLCWFPLGGFVKFYGMLPTESVPDEVKGKEFSAASLPKRVATVSAGPLANLGLAFVVYTVLGMAGIPHPQAIIGEIQEGSPAERAGLEFNDQIIAIGEEKIKTWMEMRDIIAKSAEKRLELTVKRAGKTLKLELVPEKSTGENMNGEKVPIGRAGISRGAVPAVVTVLGKNSAAGRAGLSSGMRILSVKYGDQEEGITYWQGFLLALSRAVQANAKSIEIVAARTHKDSSAVANESKTYKLDLTGIVLNVSTGSSWGYRRSLASQLGFSDAQLLVGEWQGEDAQLKKNDRIIAWSGQTIRDLYHFLEIQSENHTPNVELKIERDGRVETLPINLKAIERQLPSGKETLYILPATMLGLAEEPEPYIERYENIFEALAYGAKETAVQTTFLAGTLLKLFTGDVPLKALGGPMLIAKVAGDAAEAGWKAFVATLALISVNLAVLNLLPLPALDGGQLVLFGVEAIRRKRLSVVAIENFQKVGFAVIMALVVLATYNDLSRFWAAMIRSITGSIQ